jgi:hypothetical protein
MPIEINWIPPMKRTEKIIDVHPSNALCVKNLMKSTYNKYKKLRNEIKDPITVEIRRGVEENDVIPSNANEIIFLISTTRTNSVRVISETSYRH